MAGWFAHVVESTTDYEEYDEFDTDDDGLGCAVADVESAVGGCRLA